MLETYLDRDCISIINSYLVNYTKYDYKDIFENIIQKDITRHLIQYDKDLLNLHISIKMNKNKIIKYIYKHDDNVFSFGKITNTDSYFFYLLFSENFWDYTIECLLNDYFNITFNFSKEEKASFELIIKYLYLHNYDKELTYYDEDVFMNEDELSDSEEYYNDNPNAGYHCRRCTCANCVYF